MFARAARPHCHHSFNNTDIDMHTNMKTLQAKRAEALALFVFMGLFATMMGIALWFSLFGK
jgi:hypothetical protein